MNLEEIITKWGYLSFKNISNTPMIIKIKDDGTIITLEPNIVKILLQDTKTASGDIANIVNIATYTPSDTRKKELGPDQDVDYDVMQNGKAVFSINDQRKSEITLTPIIIQITRLPQQMYNGETAYNVNSQIKMVTHNSELDKKHVSS